MRGEIPIVLLVVILVSRIAYVCLPLARKRKAGCVVWLHLEEWL